MGTQRVVTGSRSASVFTPVEAASDLVTAIVGDRVERGWPAAVTAFAKYRRCPGQQSGSCGRPGRGRDRGSGRADDQGHMQVPAALPDASSRSLPAVVAPVSVATATAPDDARPSVVQDWRIDVTFLQSGSAADRARRRARKPITVCSGLSADGASGFADERMGLPDGRGPPGTSPAAKHPFPCRPGHSGARAVDHDQQAEPRDAAS